jgi:hypothetical protein
LRGWSDGRAAHRSRSALRSASLMPAIARLWRCFSILAAHLLGSVLIATYHAGNAQPDGDANDCPMGITSEGGDGGRAVMAYLGRSPNPLPTRRSTLPPPTAPPIRPVRSARRICPHSASTGLSPSHL